MTDNNNEDKKNVVDEVNDEDATSDTLAVHSSNAEINILEHPNASYRRSNCSSDITDLESLLIFIEKNKNEIISTQMDFEEFKNFKLSSTTSFSSELSQSTNEDRSGKTSKENENQDGNTTIPKIIAATNNDNNEDNATGPHVNTDKDHEEVRSSNRSNSSKHSLSKSTASLNIPETINQSPIEKEPKSDKDDAVEEIISVHTTNSDTVTQQPMDTIPSVASNEPTGSTNDNQPTTTNETIQQTSNVVISGAIVEVIPNTNPEQNFVPMVLHVPYNMNLNDRAEIESSTPFNTIIFPTYGPNVRHFTTNTVLPSTPLTEVGEVSITLPTPREEQSTSSRIYEYERTTAMYSTPNFRTAQDSEFNVEEGFRPFRSADAIQRSNLARQFRK